jgi:ferredoxin--NADP+ reductase
MTTMNNAFDTAKSLLADLDDGIIAPVSRAKIAGVASLLEGRGVELVDFDGWLAIDTVEKTTGERAGKPREKVTQVSSMLAIAAEQATK